MYLCCLLTFSKFIFSRISSRQVLLECQAVWIQIRTDILSVLIWVQTVCKVYEQMTLAGKELMPLILL